MHKVFGSIYLAGPGLIIDFILCGVFILAFV